jgi:PAS domain S-box-containing protein
VNEGLSLAPVWFTDVVGSALMVVFSFLSVKYALKLSRVQPDHVIWTYLLWLTTALAVFAVSRSVGHIAKRLLLLMEMGDVWKAIRPVSGGLNTLTFAAVAALTLFFQRVQKINATALEDKHALEQASYQVRRLNRDLESLVQRRTEELSRSERKYRRIFEGSMDMIFILDEEGRFLDINGAGVQILGANTKDDLVGRAELTDFFVNEKERQAWMNELKSRGFVKDRECRITSRAGSELALLLSVAERKESAGRSSFYEGMGKDVTSRRRMERQLQMADKLASLGQISAGIAHEINNPLGIVMGYTQLLLRGTAPGTQAHDDLKTIEKHARNCKTVVEDLLKFARSTRTNKTSVDLNQCIGEVLPLLAHQMELDDICVTIDLHDGPLYVVGDSEKLKQVFMNLLVNARQAVRKEGVITVRTFVDPDGTAACARISDSGCGIPPDLMHKIFDPFFTTKPVGEGTGLGLSVSYGIVQDHGGRIEVESRVGEGSVFTVELPLDPAHRDAPMNKEISTSQDAQFREA